MNPPTIKAGDVVVVNFPGVVETKRRPAVVVSSDIYHATRPDVIIGLITSQAVATTPTDYLLQDWAVLLVCAGRLFSVLSLSPNHVFQLWLA
jgi:mRNA-degrading endonuclease toxin of MazEF toxin-antitoxin module